MIGRGIEYEKLQAAIDKDRAQLIAVYGRRRVGKTFLVNEFFENRFAFKHTAVSPVDESVRKNKAGLMRIQLREFYYSMRSYGLDDNKSVPEDWFEAFHVLERLLSSKGDGGQQVIFIDELPWMDTPRSNFIPAFEHFCNDWCLARKNIKLVVCGSATSWILDNLINSKGGLYGRVTMPVYVAPFSLNECREFFRKEGFAMDDYSVILAYMAFGGIPYYLDQFRKGLSVPQNIDALLFEENAPLKDEYDRLFTSQFANPDDLRKIVKILSSKRIGYTRCELIDRGKFSSGGTFSGNLAALEKSKLIASYVPFGGGEKKYRLADPFCSFYLEHVVGNTGRPTYWQEHFNSPKINAWQGYAFEDLCFNHIRQIKHAIGIDNVISNETPWIVPSEEKRGGTQIDMIIERDDRFVCMCEMKFSKRNFEVNKAYSEKLSYRMERLQEAISKRKSVMSILVTTYGLARNEYSSGFQKTITMEDLFQK